MATGDRRTGPYDQSQNNRGRRDTRDDTGSRSRSSSSSSRNDLWQRATREREQSQERSETAQSRHEAEHNQGMQRWEQMLPYTLQHLLQYIREVRQRRDHLLGQMMVEMRKEQYITQHRQRMQNVAQQLKIEIPNQTTQEWSNFASQVFDNIVDEKSLNSGQSVMLGDILQGGVNNKFDRQKRDKEEYKQLMKEVLTKWRDRNNTRDNT